MNISPAIKIRAYGIPKRERERGHSWEREGGRERSGGRAGERGREREGGRPGGREREGGRERGGGREAADVDKTRAPIGLNLETCQRLGYIEEREKRLG